MSRILNRLINRSFTMTEDYGMDDGSWNQYKSKVMTFLDSNDIGEMKQVIEWNIATGDADSENRKRYATSILTLFSMLSNSPFSEEDNVGLPTQGLIYCVMCEEEYRVEDRDFYGKNFENDYYELGMDTESGCCRICLEKKGFEECEGYSCGKFTKKHCRDKQCNAAICFDCKSDEVQHKCLYKFHKHWPSDP